MDETSFHFGAHALLERVAKLPPHPAISQKLRIYVVFFQILVDGLIRVTKYRVLPSEYRAPLKGYRDMAGLEHHPHVPATSIDSIHAVVVDEMLRLTSGIVDGESIYLIKDSGKKWSDSALRMSTMLDSSGGDLRLAEDTVQSWIGLGRGRPSRIFVPINQIELAAEKLGRIPCR